MFAECIGKMGGKGMLNRTLFPFCTCKHTAPYPERGMLNGTSFTIPLAVPHLLALYPEFRV